MGALLCSLVHSLRLLSRTCFQESTLDSFFKRRHVTKPLLISYILQAHHTSEDGEWYATKSTLSLVPFHYKHNILSGPLKALTDARDAKKTSPMSSAKSTMWRFGDATEGLREGVEVALDSNVEALCDQLDEVVKVAIEQAYNLAETLSESDIQNLVMPLEQILLFAFDDEDIKLHDARSSPSLVLQLGGNFLNGHADGCTVMQFQWNDRPMDVVVKVGEYKAPKAPASVPAEEGDDALADSYTPPSAAQPAPLNGAHIAQCFAEMAAVVGRHTIGRPFKMSEIEKSPVRTWGQVTNGFVGIVIRWLGPDPVCPPVDGEHKQVLHITISKPGHLFRQNYELLRKAAAYKIKLKIAKGTSAVPRSASGPPARPSGGDGAEGDDNENDGGGKNKGGLIRRVLNSFRSPHTRHDRRGGNGGSTGGGGSRGGGGRPGGSTLTPHGSLKVKRRGLVDVTNSSDFSDGPVICVPLPPPVPVNPVVQEWMTGVLLHSE
jgi:hypothetical protein